MKDPVTYSIGEFARLAGVTVRTLHFYDEVGLLPVKRRADNQRREYRQDDLLRLQQILTLKQLGFSLEQVEVLLASPAYDVRAALHGQKRALEAQIRQLQTVVFALGQTAEALETRDEVDWNEVTAILRGLSEASNALSISAYLPPEWQAWIAERAAQTPQSMIEEGPRLWTELYADFAKVHHLPPEDAQVQTLAAKMDRLGAMFTGRNAAVEEALGQLYSDVTQIPAPFRVPGVDQDLQDFMFRAMTIYRGKANPDEV